MASLIRTGGAGLAREAESDRAVRRATTRGSAAPALSAAAGLALLFALACFAGPAHAEEVEAESDEASEAPEVSEPGWIPSIDVGFETFDYNVDTTVVNFVNPPRWTGTQQEAERQLMFRLGGELLTPAFADLPGRPRLFVQGGAQFRTFSSDDIFAVGDPTIFAEPETDIRAYYRQGNDTGQDLPLGFVGQGSDTFARFQDPSWYAAIGVAFSVPIARDLLLQIKPSFEYSLEKIYFASKLTTVDELNPHEDPDFDTPTRTFVVHRGSSASTTEDHSVGAGLELALVLFKRLRPIRVSLYTEARFLWLVSGRTTTFADSTGVASFTVERDALGIKGGGGLRISWVGFD